MEDLFSCLVIQGASRLVAKEDFRLLGHRTRNGHPLLFTARQLGRKIVEAMAQSHFCQNVHRVHGILDDFGSQLHIFLGGQVGHQIVKLKDKADIISAVIGPLMGVELGDIHSINEDLPLIIGIHTTQDIEQGGFSRPRRP